jgi:aspartate aminotransferase
MTGWRIGWAAGPAELISALDMLQSQSVSNASSISQAAALAALQGDQGFVAEWAKIYKDRRDLALSMLNSVEGISCRTPDGAFYLYVNCSGMIGRTTPECKKLASDMDVAMYLLEGVGVAVIPGTVYGLSPYFRMSIATSLEVIKDGCQRIARAVDALV